MIFIRVCVIGDHLFAVVADVIFVRILVIGDYLVALKAAEFSVPIAIFVVICRTTHLG